LSGASAINNNHQVVGGSDNAEGWGHAVMWSSGKIRDLGTLGGTQSAAYAINDLGHVVGWAHTTSEATHVFLFSAGRMHDLGTFGLDPVALAINNHSVIVGISGRGAFVFSKGVSGTQRSDPARLGLRAHRSDRDQRRGTDRGQRVQHDELQHHAFLLSPS
jgi:probable HAF family extracellular repeat protein